MRRLFRIAGTAGLQIERAQLVAENYALCVQAGTHQGNGEPTITGDTAQVPVTFHEVGQQRQVVINLRHQGREWADIAAEVGGSPEALRKKLSRTVERVAQELGLDDLPGV